MLKATGNGLTKYNQIKLTYKGAMVKFCKSTGVLDRPIFILIYDKMHYV